MEPPFADVRGRWGMYTDNTDWVVADLEQEGNSLTGVGCYNGFLALQDPEYFASDCGEIAGSIVGNRVAFGFLAQDVGEVPYAAELFVDDLGTRMAGFTQQSDLGNALSVWLRVPSDMDHWLTSEFTWPDEFLRERYELELVAATGGDQYTAEQSYIIKIDDRGGFGGDLGAFWGSEFSVEPDASTVVITAGPVPVTHPDLPIRMKLGFQVGLLRIVEADTPDGANYRFAARLQAR